MRLSPLIAVMCAIVGGISGANAGAAISPVWSIVGGGLGVVLGFASFLAVVIPYVGWLMWIKKRRHPVPLTQPPRLWINLFLPVMLSTLVLAAVVPWYVVGLALE
jgi:hypothetical protein